MKILIAPSSGSVIDKRERKKIRRLMVEGRLDYREDSDSERGSSCLRRSAVHFINDVVTSSRNVRHTD